jgi:mono/diheme cytochrome c family protein
MRSFDRASGVARSLALIFTLVLGPAQAADQASVARGAGTWADNCDRCHEMRDPRDFQPDQWRVIVTHMRIRAGLTGQESRDVRAFLDQSSAPGSGLRPASAAAQPAGPSQAGKQVYEGTCIACHGANGKGSLRGVPDLTASSGPLSKPDAVLLERIEQGFQTPRSPMAMPPKGGNPTLTEADLGAVLQYMHSTFGR